MWIDAQVPPDQRTTTPSRRQLVSGPAQISVAAAFLAGLRPGVRELGRRVGLSAPSISTAPAGLISWHHESGFPIGHALFVALELAQDPARGAEALELWDPKGFDRVW